jgi:ferric-dicitrate binding protein FerR (iron transport regulator)
VSDRFDPLASRYLDGAATAEEVRELDARLRQDPDARRRFVLLADQETAVADLAAALPARRKRRRIPDRAPSRLWIGIAAAAAGVLLALTLAAPRPARRAPAVEPVPIVLDRHPAPQPMPALERPAPLPDLPREAPKAAPPLPGLTKMPDIFVNTPAPPQKEEEPRKTVAAPPAPAPAVPALAVVSAEGIGGARAPFSWTEGASLSAGQAPGTLVLENGIRLSLSAGAELRLAAVQPPALELAKGEVHCSVPPQKGLAFAVLTASTEVRVTGTQFLVALEADATRARVDEGSVRVTRRSDGKGLTLRAGQVFSVGPGQPFAARLRAPNLLSDPGFEAGGRGWRGFEGRPPPLGPGVSLVPGGHRGKVAIQLADGFQGTLTQGVAVEPGATYEFEAFMKLAGPGSWGMSVVWLDETGNWKAWVKADNFPVLTGPRDWTRWSGSFTAPPRAKTAWVVVYTSQPGAACFDDFYIGLISR